MHYAVEHHLPFQVFTSLGRLHGHDGAMGAVGATALQGVATGPLDT